MIRKEKAKKIAELREQGYGYRSIAFFVNESRDSVRNYCRKNELTGRRSILNQY